MPGQVVEVREVRPGILEIKMQDRANKNTFSLELAEGLIEAFKSSASQPQYKVVVLTGYDSYFASGGTKEGLLFLSAGKGKFTDTDLYSLALNCPVPVIGAMQGHGIGGGFVLGMFADFPILSRESIYTTNFMKYGFTPGMGATFILPRKLGIGLAEEMMIVARTYRGEELQKRGIPFPVLPRAEVMEYALELAATIAEKPRISLVTLKDHLVASLRTGLAPVIEQELVMHAKTFHRPEVKDRIEALFGS
jgi:polyketide biosynthesis enoyl-CoA hydratase PksI